MTAGLLFNNKSVQNSGLVIQDVQVVDPRVDNSQNVNYGVNGTPFEFIPAGWVKKRDGTYTMVKPNVVRYIAATDRNGITFFANAMANRGEVFCGRPQKLLLSFRSFRGAAADNVTVYSIWGMNGKARVSENVNIPAGIYSGAPYTVQLQKYYTDIISVFCVSSAGSAGNEAYAFISAMPISNQKNASCAASLDLNSSSGALALPCLDDLQIIKLDAMPELSPTQPNMINSSQVPVQIGANLVTSPLPFTRDGMMVYNPTTRCVSTKRGGQWDNMYLEDPARTQHLTMTRKFTSQQLVDGLNLTTNPAGIVLLGAGPTKNNDNAATENIILKNEQTGAIAAGLYNFNRYFDYPGFLGYQTTGTTTGTHQVYFTYYSNGGLVREGREVPNGRNNPYFFTSQKCTYLVSVEITGDVSGLSQGTITFFAPTFRYNIRSVFYRFGINGNPYVNGLAAQSKGAFGLAYQPSRATGHYPGGIYYPVYYTKIDGIQGNNTTGTYDVLFSYTSSSTYNLNEDTDAVEFGAPYSVLGNGIALKPTKGSSAKLTEGSGTFEVTIEYDIVY